LYKNAINLSRSEIYKTKIALRHALKGNLKKLDVEGIT
jgi:hypothetical protein